MSPGRVQPAKMDSLVRTPEQKYAELLVGDRCRLVVVALETGTICIPRLEEEVVSHAVHLVCASVRHLFDGGAQGVARGGQRRWRDS